MNVVLKNNRNLLPKRDKFKTSISSFPKTKTEFNLPKASPKLLRDIKKRILEERQSRHKKIIVVWSIIMMIFISGFIYLAY